MKKIYLLTTGLLVLLAAACNKDDSTLASSLPVAELSVKAGLKDTFNVYTYKDTLRITPEVTNENDFDFYWTLFSTDFAAVNSLGLVKPDTVGRTKNLNYVVLKDPGTYYLVFNAKDKTTGIVRQKNMVANFSTLNMTGWYLVKDNGGKTDMDFIYPTGRIDNWIATYNNGKNLDGDAVKAIFVPSFKSSLTTQATFPAFMVASKNDAAIYRVDNGAQFMNFDNMFFSKPATRKPQGIFQPITTNFLGFINDGKAYAMYKGTLFANMPLTLNNISYNNLSPMTAVAAMDLGWDPVRKSVFLYNGQTYQELKVNSTNLAGKLLNTNANLQWMTGYPGGRSVAMVLLRNPQDTGYLYKLNASFGPLFTGSGVLIMNADTLKPQHSLMNASVIGGNYDVDLIYYATNGKIYMTDVASATETYLFDVPVGETVTAIQHIRYPEPVGTPVPPATVNYIAIATSTGSRYKVYLHTISGTGTLSPAPVKFEGDGRVTGVMYMEQGKGTRIF
ncbi:MULTISPECIES: PKD-like family lipoprotein [Niastella]|uniref:PKD family protein n=1 Tax=Niastella soli TaxID=2821487 RepID=A0ABS3YYJ9_9BACT|nr:PKD-like family lipoprotein [Niastella soli]MBO9202995.1 hypothetical protein [Niastella soli]